MKKLCAMTVGELRKQLRGVPPQMEVHVQVNIEHPSFNLCGCLPLLKCGSVANFEHGVQYIHLWSWWDLEAGDVA